MTHGTPTGYTNGCHGEASCANHKTGRMTCTEANVRYAGDYAYRKAVDNGTATDEREVFAKDKRPSRRVVVETKAEAAKRPKRVVKAPKKTAAPKVVRVQRPQTHGSPFNARNCKDNCPNEAAGGPSCRQAHRAYQNAYYARARAGEGPPVKHGTRYGYQAGCQDRATCPKPAGETCADMQTAYARMAYARARYAA